MEKMFFYIDSLANQAITYQNLLEDIRNVKSYNRFCKNDDYYALFRSIVLSMLLGKELILLDEDFTESELDSLVGLSVIAEAYEDVDPIVITDIQTKEQLVSRLLETSVSWSLTLFTSGTTGLPKKISHSFQSISRTVRRSDRHVSSVWGFAYNPSHMAGIQVFLQALLNGNTIVRLFKLGREDLLLKIQQFNVSHISATPTFYRLLLPADRTLNTVTHLTSGGERFDKKTLEALSKMFPNAKITNVYASTEAGTVLASSGDHFEIKSEFQNLVKIENNELILHQSLMGTSETLKLQPDGWYATGDIVEIISEHPLCFKFVSRKNEMINVGGYKVNPGEVEEILLLMDGIREVRVYGKSNSLIGNIVCADVVVSSDGLAENIIRRFLQDKLQDFKIPRKIRFVDSLQVTRTGKVQRT